MFWIVITDECHWCHQNREGMFQIQNVSNPIAVKGFTSQKEELP